MVILPFVLLASNTAMDCLTSTLPPQTQTCIPVTPTQLPADPSPYYKGNGMVETVLEVDFTLCGDQQTYYTEHGHPVRQRCTFSTHNAG